MQQLNTELVESRVDWITATMELEKATGSEQIERALSFSDKLLCLEENKGNDMQRRSWRQYHGLASGQAFVGRDGGGLIFRLSGDAARDHWRAVHEVATNVSRIDVAATVEMKGAWRDLSLVHLDEVKRYRRERSPRLKVVRIDGGKDGCSLNVGSRSSDQYGRIYDKGAESKRSEYQDCWRYEVEFKRDAAQQVADALATDDLIACDPAAVALEWFAVRHVSHGQVLSGSTLPSRCLQAADDHRRLEWLSRDVALCVAKLVNNGKCFEVLKALKLSDEVLRSAGFLRAAGAAREEV